MSDHDDATVEPDGTARPNDDGSLSAVQEFGILVGVVVVTATLRVVAGWRGAVLGLLGILVWTQLVRLVRDDG